MSRAPRHLVRRHRSSENEMRPTQSVNEHGSQPRPGRRHRRIGVVMLVAGVIVLVAAFAPTSANAVIPNSFLNPAGPATFTQSCVGVGDPASTLIPSLFPDGLFLPTEMTTNPIDSPSDGETFTLQVSLTTTLPASLVAVAQSAGTTSLTQTNTSSPLTASGGATGTATITDPGPTTTNLPPAHQPAADVFLQSGSFDVSFTRSGTDPVVLTPGTTTTTSSTQPDGSGIALGLSCEATNVTPLTLTDQVGETPEPTTAAPVATLPPAPATTAAPAAAAAPVVEATGTSGSTLARTGFHGELLFLGIALLGAGYAMSLTGRRVARASTKSR